VRVEPAFAQIQKLLPNVGALAPSPALLLLDEPLSALDARVRQSLRHEIRGLQRRLGVTTIMVTHDQEEALAMADRIVVMNGGLVEQVGAPTEVYRRPRTPFVARFVGHMNFLSAVAAGRRGWARVGAVELRHQPGFEAAPGGSLTLAIRPEEIAVGPAALRGDNRLTARITAVQFLGPFTRLGLQPAVRFDVTRDDVNSLLALPLSRIEHGVRFPDARGVAEEDLQPSAMFAR